MVGRLTRHLSTLVLLVFRLPVAILFGIKRRHFTRLLNLASNRMVARVGTSNMSTAALLWAGW